MNIDKTFCNTIKCGKISKKAMDRIKEWNKNVEKLEIKRTRKWIKFLKETDCGLHYVK